jgi:hypothetical protein
MNKHWDMAYKSAHVAADICDGIAMGKTATRAKAQWLLREANDLQRAAQALNPKCRAPRKARTTNQVLYFE